MNWLFQFRTMTLLLVVILTSQLPAQISEHYYLIFSARPATLKPFSIGGHAFVSWGRGDSNEIKAQRSFGFYPKPKSNLCALLFKKNPGRVENGFKTNSRGVRVTQMVMELDSLHWYESLQTADVWNGEPYNLWDYNCTAYVDGVAKMVHLKTPRRKTLFGFPRAPVKYIERLWRKNQKRSTKPARIYYENSDTKVATIILGPNDFVLKGTPPQDEETTKIENRARVEAGFFDINFARNFNTTRQ